MFAFTTGVVLLFETIEMLRRAGPENDIDLWTVMAMAALKSPYTLHLAMPFVVMVAAMLTFWRLTRSSELVVARSVGVSVWRILAPPVLLSLLLGVLEVTAVNPLSSAMFSLYERMEQRELDGDDTPMSLSESGLWLRELRDGEQVLVHADNVRQAPRGGLRLETVSILVFGAGDEYRYRLDGREALLEEGVVRLIDAWMFRPGEPARHLESLDHPTSLTVNKIQDKFADPQNLSFWELPGFIDFYESAGFSAQRQRMYWHTLLAQPLVLCAMTLLAAAFMLHHNLRGVGVTLRVAGGVGVGFVYYATSKVVYVFGASAALPLLLAAWSPPIVAALIGLTALLHLEEG